MTQRVKALDLMVIYLGADSGNVELEITNTWGRHDHGEVPEEEDEVHHEHEEDS